MGNSNSWEVMGFPFYMLALEQRIMLCIYAVIAILRTLIDLWYF